MDDCANAMAKVVDLAVDSGIILEVNESSLVVNDGGAADRLRVWLPYAKERGAIISLGTDAHFCSEVGRFDNTIRLLKEIKYPPEKIVNCNEALLQRFLPEK